MKAWLSSHIKPLGLLVATLYMALKPELFDGQVWNLTQWLGFASFGVGTVLGFIQGNFSTGIAARAKEISVVTLATLGVLTSVLPDGLSRADVSTIIVAVAASLWSLIPGTTPTHQLNPSSHADGH